MLAHDSFQVDRVVYLLAATEMGRGYLQFPTDGTCLDVLFGNTYTYVLFLGIRTSYPSAKGKQVK
jgi:hypothetical protein